MSWNQEQLETLLNKHIYDFGFISCGSSKGTGFGGYKFNIYCPKGTKMLYAEPFSKHGKGSGLKWDGIEKQKEFSDEDETIIQRGTTFKIIKVEKTGGFVNFDLEVIEQIE
jgi:hypothetical protein